MAARAAGFRSFHTPFEELKGLELNPAKPLAPNSPGVATNSNPRFPQEAGFFFVIF